MATVLYTLHAKKQAMQHHAHKWDLTPFIPVASRVVSSVDGASNGASEALDQKSKERLLVGSDLHLPCSPGLIFLSQSVLSEDGSMNIKLAHEVSHSWFGLLLGARDWTEEWLSEGFATFLEDHVHAAVMNVSGQFL